METRRLRSFIEIVNAGSLTRAAANIGIAQPALSQQLLDMEHQFGTKLLLRSHLGVKPTPAGMTLYRHSQVILRQLEQAERDVANQEKTISGSVSVGMLYSTAPTLLVPLIRQVIESYPLIELHVIEGMSGSLSDSTNKHDLDMSILSGDVDSLGLQSTPLLVEELFFISSAATLSPVEGNSIELKQLGNIPLVLPARSHNLRKLIDNALNRHDVSINLVAEVDSLSGLAATAGAGLACTILPAVALSGNRQMLRMQPITNPAIERMISLSVAKSLPLMPAAQSVYQTLTALVTGLVVTGAWPGARTIEGRNTES